MVVTQCCVVYFVAHIVAASASGRSARVFRTCSPWVVLGFFFSTSSLVGTAGCSGSCHIFPAPCWAQPAASPAASAGRPGPATGAGLGATVWFPDRELLWLMSEPGREAGRPRRPSRCSHFSFCSLVCAFPGCILLAGGAHLLNAYVCHGAHLQLTIFKSKLGKRWHELRRFRQHIRLLQKVAVQLLDF